ncbi:TTAGGG repeat binding factor [Ceratocystis pirilliformis]|uniref:TTAGGG repeat binding factor n=1 Tax=Ceratocystis pirilliformis TaxID=259994 RepID=A0ABR3YMJ5_9PEZI
MASVVTEATAAQLNDDDISESMVDLAVDPDALAQALLREFEIQDLQMDVASSPKLPESPSRKRSLDELDNGEHGDAKRLKLSNDGNDHDFSGLFDSLVNNTLGEVHDLMGQIPELEDDSHDLGIFDADQSPTGPLEDDITIAPMADVPSFALGPSQARRAMSTPLLANSAIQIIMILSEQPFSSTIAQLRNDQSEARREFLNISMVFEQSFKLYTHGDVTRIMTCDDIGFYNTSAKQTVRLANLACTCPGVFAKQGLQLMFDKFFELFLPDQAELTADIADLYLGLRTQMFLEDISIENFHTLLDSMFEFEPVLQSRRDDCELTQTENDLIAAAHARKAAVIQHHTMNPMDSLISLRLKYVYDDFLANLNMCLHRILGSLADHAAAFGIKVPVPISKGDDYSLDIDLTDEDLSTFLQATTSSLVENVLADLMDSHNSLEDVDQMIADASIPAAPAPTPIPSSMTDPEISTPVSVPTATANSTPGSMLVSTNGKLDFNDFKALEAIVAESTSNYVRTTLDGISKTSYNISYPTTTSGLSSKLLSIQGLQNLQKDVTEAVLAPDSSANMILSRLQNNTIAGTNSTAALAPATQAYYQYSQAEVAQPTSTGVASASDLPPNQTCPSSVLYDKARQAALSKSSSHTRREGVHSTRRPWTQEEEKALMTGLDLVKGPHWSQILTLFGANGTHGDILKDRTQVQLKDKARNLKLFFLKTNSEMPYYLQAVTGELKTRAPTQAARKEAEERARLNAEEDKAKINGLAGINGLMSLNSLQGQQRHLQQQSGVHSFGQVQGHAAHNVVTPAQAALAAAQTPGGMQQIKQETHTAPHELHQLQQFNQMQTLQQATQQIAQTQQQQVSQPQQTPQPQPQIQQPQLQQMQQQLQQQVQQQTAQQLQQLQQASQASQQQPARQLQRQQEEVQPAQAPQLQVPQPQPQAQTAAALRQTQQQQQAAALLQIQQHVAQLSRTASPQQPAFTTPASVPTPVSTPTAQPQPARHVQSTPIGSPSATLAKAPQQIPKAPAHQLMLPQPTPPQALSNSSTPSVPPPQQPPQARPSMASQPTPPVAPAKTHLSAPPLLPQPVQSSTTAAPTSASTSTTQAQPQPSPPKPSVLPTAPASKPEGSHPTPVLPIQTTDPLSASAISQRISEISKIASANGQSRPSILGNLPTTIPSSNGSSAPTQNNMQAQILAQIQAQVQAQLAQARVSQIQAEAEAQAKAQIAQAQAQAKAQIAQAQAQAPSHAEYQAKIQAEIQQQIAQHQALAQAQLQAQAQQQAAQAKAAIQAQIQAQAQAQARAKIQQAQAAAQAAVQAQAQAQADVQAQAQAQIQAQAQAQARAHILAQAQQQAQQAQQAAAAAAASRTQVPAVSRVSTPAQAQVQSAVVSPAIASKTLEAAQTRAPTQIAPSPISVPQAIVAAARSARVTALPSPVGAAASITPSIQSREITPAAQTIAQVQASMKQEPFAASSRAIQQAAASQNQVTTTSSQTPVFTAQQPQQLQQQPSGSLVDIEQSSSASISQSQIARAALVPVASESPAAAKIPQTPQAPIMASSAAHTFTHGQVQPIVAPETSPPLTMAAATPVPASPSVSHSQSPALATIMANSTYVALISTPTPTSAPVVDPAASSVPASDPAPAPAPALTLGLVPVPVPQTPAQIPHPRTPDLAKSQNQTATAQTCAQMSQQGLAQQPGVDNEQVMSTTPQAQVCQTQSLPLPISSLISTQAAGQSPVPIPKPESISATFSSAPASNPTSIPVVNSASPLAQVSPTATFIKNETPAAYTTVAASVPIKAPAPVSPAFLPTTDIMAETLSEQPLKKEPTSAVGLEPSTSSPFASIVTRAPGSGPSQGQSQSQSQGDSQSQSQGQPQSQTQGSATNPAGSPSGIDEAAQNSILQGLQAFIDAATS